MEITVGYRQRNGIERSKKFGDDIVSAFDFWYSLVNAVNVPIIYTDTHMGVFSFLDIEPYMVMDQEGKNLAYKRFQNWFNDNWI